MYHFSFQTHWLRLGKIVQFNLWLQNISLRTVDSVYTACTDYILKGNHQWFLIVIFPTIFGLILNKTVRLFLYYIDKSTISLSDLF